MTQNNTAGLMGLTDWGRLFLLALLWGGSFIFAGLILRELPPVVMVFLRFSVAALALGLVMVMSGRAVPRGFAAWRLLLGMSLLNNVLPFVLYAFAQTAIPANLAAIMNAVTPILTALVLHGAGVEKLTVNRVIGVLFGFLGVTILVAPRALVALDASVAALLGCLLATGCYALSTLVGRHVQAAVGDPISAAFGMLSLSGFLMAPIMLVLHPISNFALPSLTTMASVFGIAVLATAWAYVVFYRLMASAGPSNLMLVTFLIPVVAMVLSIMLLGEAVTLNAVIGMMVIWMGLAAIDGRPIAWLRQRLSPR